MTAPKLLFVCLGNICRSPLAEGALRAQAQAAGRVLEVDSAGTGSWHAGNPPDRRAIAVARRHGVDISRQRARPVQEADFRRFTHLIALDRAVLKQLHQMAPGHASAEISLLFDWLPGREGEDVADPYWGTAAGFERTWADCLAATAAVLERV